jgi:hypothetical protein
MKLKVDVNAVNEEMINNIETVLKSSQGKCNVEFYIEDPIENINVRLYSKSQKVAITSELMMELNKIGDLTYELN